MNDTMIKSERVIMTSSVTA